METLRELSGSSLEALDDCQTTHLFPALVIEPAGVGY
jgi:hypothetical protein